MKHYLIKVKDSGCYYKAPLEGVTNNYQDAYVYSEAELQMMSRRNSGYFRMMKDTCLFIEVEPVLR